MIIIDIALGLLVLLLFLIIRNLYIKIVFYENVLNKYYNLLTDIRDYMNLTLEKLYKIDSNHIFEGDDDVGWFFSSLKSFLIELNNNISEMVITHEKENESK